MKKTAVLFILVALVAVTIIIWITEAKFSGSIEEWGLIAGVMLVLGFAALIGIMRLKSHSRNEPADDELSKQLVRRASSLSYFISIYLWLALSFVNDHIELGTSATIGAGILGMAIVFFLSWLYYRLRGIRNE